jgi:hypothetical protein
MPNEPEILFSLAGRVHVLLRREVNRIIDVEWMCADPAYTQEVIKLARGAESEELHKLADRVEEVHPLLRHLKYPDGHVVARTEPKYVATLR